MPHLLITAGGILCLVVIVISERRIRSIRRLYKVGLNTNTFLREAVVKLEKQQEESERREQDSFQERIKMKTELAKADHIISALRQREAAIQQVLTTGRPQLSAPDAEILSEEEVIIPPANERKEERYVIIVDHDHPNPCLSDGPMIWEQYMRDTYLFQVLNRSKQIDHRYGVHVGTLTDIMPLADFKKKVGCPDE